MKLPQRGKSNQKRADLRLFSLALLVSRDGQIPLCSQVQEGNKVDSKLFPESLNRVRQRMSDLSATVEDVTAVYDKSKLSKANEALADEAPFGYVASLTPAQQAELMAIPSDRYQPLRGGPPVPRLRRQIRGAERTVVLLISEQLRAGQYISEVLHVEFDMERSGAGRLHYWVDEEARTRLETEVFGNRILLTNRDEWPTEEIVLAYRGQHHVEAVFRQCKDDQPLEVRSQFH